MSKKKYNPGYVKRFITPQTLQSSMLNIDDSYSDHRGDKMVYENSSFPFLVDQLTGGANNRVLYDDVIDHNHRYGRLGSRFTYDTAVRPEKPKNSRYSTILFDFSSDDIRGGGSYCAKGVGSTPSESLFNACRNSGLHLKGKESPVRFAQGNGNYLPWIKSTERGNHNV